MSEVKIDLYDPSRDSLDEITDLLHKSYAGLASMGFNYVAATQSALVTAKRLTVGNSYIARSDGSKDDHIVGTITYYPSTMPGFHEPEHYMKATVAHFGQFAVLPQAQKLGIGNKLMTTIESHAQQAGKQEIACDTAEGASDLIEFYTKRGYRPVGVHQWSHACYRSVLLTKSLPVLKIVC